MAADSDSRIAWHRAQVRKHRDTLKRMETSKFTTGQHANPKMVAQSKKLVAELTQKIRLSEQAIAEHERTTRRPLATSPGAIGTPMAASGEGGRAGPHCLVGCRALSG
jgi:hypothetical protein